MKMQTLLITLLLISASCSQKAKKPYVPQEPKKCTYKRAAFHMGPEEIRLKVAKVDACKGLLLSSELDLREQISFREDLRKAHQSQFSGKIMEQALKILGDMKAKARELDPDGYIGVATELFRDAKNAKPFVEKINQELGINMQIVTAVDESILGFHSAFHSSRAETKEQLVAWHISSQSQQIVFYKGFKRFEIYNNKLGSKTFKNYVLKRIQRKSTYSPNPMNKYQVDLAMNHVLSTANKTLKATLLEKVSDSKVKIVAMGDVHLNNVLKLIYPQGENYILTNEELEKKLSELIGKKDSDLATLLHPDTAITDLVLVLGYMKSLKINKLEVYDMNLTEGVVLNSNYWPPPL